MTGDSVVEVSVHIAAQPETVFPYFTDPGRYVQWMGADARLEPAPGGCYRVLMRDGVEASGEFVEVDPPHRLVFTWGLDPRPRGAARRHPRRRHAGARRWRDPARAAPPRPAR
jgi:uncharacterized protein YndB with AHSA1/START domain